MWISPIWKKNAYLQSEVTETCVPLRIGALRIWQNPTCAAATSITVMGQRRGQRSILNFIFGQLLKFWYYPGRRNAFIYYQKQASDNAKPNKVSSTLISDIKLRLDPLMTKQDQGTFYGNKSLRGHICDHLGSSQSYDVDRAAIIIPIFQIGKLRRKEIKLSALCIVTKVKRYRERFKLRLRVYIVWW